MSNRWDETWHRLREWTNGQAQSERLAAQLLLREAYTSLDPSHPLGGPDGGKDAVCWKDGKKWLMAVYFPRGQQKFPEIRNKFLDDLANVRTNDAFGMAFVTNQELRLAERSELQRAAGGVAVELYHLERITAILDQPPMVGIRRQFLQLSGADGSLPSFEGEIGHFEKSEQFGKFIFENIRRIVHLNVYMLEADFDGDAGEQGGFVRSWLVLWSTPQVPLAAGERPSMLTCMGTQYSFDNVPEAPESCLMVYRGAVQIQGYFTVVGASGPHQGVMGVRLRPLRAEEALRTA